MRFKRYLAGVEGFEPSKWRSQSPMPYHLATPQYSLSYHCRDNVDYYITLKSRCQAFFKIFFVFSIVPVFKITYSYIPNDLNNQSIFLSHFVDYKYTCADQYKSDQRLKAECLLCLSEQKRRKKHTANRVHKAENSDFRYGVVL